VTARSASSLYAFPSDLVDEGVEQVVQFGASLGTGSFALAMAYHQARDVVPHAGRKPRVRYRTDGVFFDPDEAIWSGVRLQPRLAPVEERLAVAALLAARPGPTVEAWTVFLHNSSLGESFPEATTRTCFDDRLLSNLCPSHPDVVAYAAALARDVASRGLDVIAEALSAQTFAHGHHHERSFTPLSEGDEALLGLCFCVHCGERAAALGSDPERLAARVRRRIQDAFAGADGIPASRDAMHEVGGDDVQGLLAARTEAVADLAAVVADGVRSAGQSLSFMDLTGAVLGYASGAPTGAPAADQAWRLAIDPAAVAEHVDSYTVLGYATDPVRLATDVASITALTGGVPVRVVLRPGHPDTSSVGHLTAKVAACWDSGAAQVDFYNYGMYDDSVLKRIPLALERAGHPVPRAHRPGRPFPPAPPQLGRLAR